MSKATVLSSAFEGDGESSSSDSGVDPFRPDVVVRPAQMIQSGDVRECARCGQHSA
jgi:hypothetical protein